MSEEGGKDGDETVRIGTITIICVELVTELNLFVATTPNYTTDTDIVAPH